MMWVNESSPTDWMQVGISLLALFLATYSIIISKKAVKVTVNTILRATEMYFTQDDDFVVKMYNSGPGIAFNAKVSAFEITGHRKRKSLLRGTWQEHKMIFASGMEEIQPNQTIDFIFEGLDVFYLHHKRPVIIRYELANGKKYTSYWIYLMGSNQKQKIVRMTKRKVLFYILYDRFFIDKF